MFTFWKIFITVIVTASVIGGGGWWYMNKKAKDDKVKLQAQIDDLNKQIKELKAASTTSTSATTIPAATTSWKNYTNTKYGFSLTFSDLWKNFEIVSKTTNDPNVLAYLYVCIPTADASWKGEKAGFYCPFAITVVEKAQKAAFDAAGDPEKPTFVAENASYAFYYSMSQAGPTDGMTARDDVKKIIATFKAS